MLKISGVYTLDVNSSKNNFFNQFCIFALLQQSLPALWSSFVIWRAVLFLRSDEGDQQPICSAFSPLHCYSWICELLLSRDFYFHVSHIVHLFLPGWPHIDKTLFSNPQHCEHEHITMVCGPWGSGEKNPYLPFFFTRSWAHQDSGSGWHFFCHAIQLWARLWAEQIGPIQQTASWETQALLSSGGHTTVLHCKSPVLKDFLIISSWFLELAYYVKVQCKCVSFQVR